VPSRETPIYVELQSAFGFYSGTGATVRLWDFKKGTLKSRVIHQGLLGTRADEPPAPHVFSPDSKTVAVAGSDGTVRLLDISGPRVREAAVLKGNEGRWVLGSFSPDRWKRDRFSSDGWKLGSFSPDGGKLALVTGTTILLWDLRRQPLGKAAVLQGYEDITEVLFSPDSKKLVAVSDGHLVESAKKPGELFSFSSEWKGCAVRLWDLDGPKPKEWTVLPGQKGPVGVVLFSPDGQTLATSGGWLTGKHSLFGGADRSDGAVRLWDLSGAQPREKAVLRRHTYTPWSVAFAPDGRSLMSVGADGLVLWSAAGDAILREWRMPGFSPHSVTFAPDCRHLATVNDNGTVYILRLWGSGEADKALADCDAALRHQSRPVPALLERARLYLRQVEDHKPEKSPGKLVRRLGDPADVATAVAFLPGGRALAAGRDGVWRLWDPDTGRELRKFGTRAPDSISWVAVSADGRHAVSAARSTVILWDVTSGRQIRTLDGQKGAVEGVAISADGRQIFAAGEDGKARVWDAVSGKLQTDFSGHAGPVRCVAPTPDGKLAVSAGEDGTVRLWDTATGKQVHHFAVPGDRITHLAIAADGRRLLTGGSDGGPRLWDLWTGRELRAFPGHQKGVASLALSADGTLALAGGDDGSLRIWDGASGEALRVFPGVDGPVNCIALSPDGRLALSVTNTGVGLWRLPLTSPRAITDLTAALRIEPKSATAYALRGRCYLHVRRYEEALADVTRAIALDAKCGEAYLTRALIHVERQAHALAVKDLDEVIRLEPQNARAFYRRGLLLLEQDEYRRARADLDQALRFDPGLGKK
jgi:WD40 repeat protein